MSWVLAIGLALAAFAAAAFAFRLPRRGWTTLATALALGMAGYALQAHPDLPGSPKAPRMLDPQLGPALIDARKAMIREERRSRNPNVLTADAFARHGQYEVAAGLLGGAVKDNPGDAEAWLALGNALVEHADGALTAPALLAYRRAQQADPSAAGPGYFMGLALIRQGRPEDAAAVWRETIAGSAADAAGRAQLGIMLERLQGALAQQPPQPAPGR